MVYGVTLTRSLMPSPAEVLSFRDHTAARAFGNRRIPMSTFVERYIDGTIDVHGDLHESCAHATSGSAIASPGSRRSSW